MCAYAGVVVDKIVTRAIVETRLVLTVINIDVALFSSVTRFAGAQEISDKVGTRRVVVTRVRVTLVNFWEK